MDTSMARKSVCSETERDEVISILAKAIARFITDRSEDVEKPLTSTEDGKTA